jgi:RNA polymerase sigma-70 factor (ECF subfamily)
MELEELIREHRQMILGIAFRIVRNPHSAEDVYQETLFKIWRALPQFRHKSSISTWIAAIARNTSISHLRLQTKHRCSALTDALHVPVKNRDCALYLQIGQLIDRLPQRERLLIELFYFERWPVKEIASLLNISNVTVRSRLYCVRRELAAISNSRPKAVTGATR